MNVASASFASEPQPIKYFFHIYVFLEVRGPEGKFVLATFIRINIFIYFIV